MEITIRIQERRNGRVQNALHNASGTSAIRFEAQVQSSGGSTILRLPDDASAKLPSRGQVAVKGRMNGHAFQTVLEPDGRRGHWLKVGKKLWQALAVCEGDTVALEVEPAKDWPEPDIPEDFQTALADALHISLVWKSITPMARWEWCAGSMPPRTVKLANDASKSLSRNFILVSDGPAASISQHAPTQTYRRTAYS